jgi:hypothetical protein
METANNRTESKEFKPEGRDFWEEVRDTVLSGMLELRKQGDEFARKSRVRMDIAQTQRRLRQAYESLGEFTYNKIRRGEPIIGDEPSAEEICARLDYYRNELMRLRAELQSSGVSFADDSGEAGFKVS